MDLLKRIKDRKPEYDLMHEELISRFTVIKGGRAGSASEETTWEEGKFFSTKYEIYMYAALLGLKTNYKLPLRQDAEKTTFIGISAWQPADIAEYVIMGVLARSPIDFYELESKGENEVEDEILGLKKLMEEYANGGFDKIRAKLEAEPTFFENNDNCFIDLLDD
jgi:hypothetical protein